jgi:ubiquinone/menaquinone biosynthesis C-methylase UbiE
MSTYILMRILESAPRRYNRGIRLLTLGRADKAYDRLAAYITPGQRVLDLGCGTGALSLRAAQKGAMVKGIDVNAQMLEIASQRIEAANLADSVKLCEMGVGELGSEVDQGYDVVVSGLCFSELSEDERVYALKEAYRVLKPRGLLLLADEVVPDGVFRWLLHWLVRLPLTAITYLLTQTTTRAVRGLPGQVRAAGFVVESVRLGALKDFAELVAVKPD